jgi:hypothetical protein
LRLLVRLRGKPLGWAQMVGLRTDELSAEAVRSLVGPVVAWEVLPALLPGRHEAFAPSQPGAPVSIVVYVRYRPDLAARLFERLTALDGPAREIVAVVDDRLNLILPPETETSTFRLYRVRGTGSAQARNRGLAECRYPITAFLDETVVPDDRWLWRLSAEFSNPEIAAVTGLVIPAELESTPQQLFDRVYGSVDRSLRRRSIRHRELAGWQMLLPSTFGSTASIAARTEVLRSLGGFDASFDVASDSSAFADVDLLHRLVAHGHTLLYEPAVLARQFYPQTRIALDRYAFEYGRGYARFLRACGRNRTVSQISLLRFAGRSWLQRRYLARLLSGRLPRHVVASELAGALAGLAARDAAPGRAPAPDGVLASVASA